MITLLSRHDDVHTILYAVILGTQALVDSRQGRGLISSASKNHRCGQPYMTCIPYTYIHARRFLVVIFSSFKISLYKNILLFRKVSLLAVFCTIFVGREVCMRINGLGGLFLVSEYLDTENADSVSLRPT